MDNRNWAVGGLALLGIVLGVIAFQVSSGPRAGVGSEPKTSESSLDARTFEQAPAADDSLRAVALPTQAQDGPDASSSPDGEADAHDPLVVSEERASVALATLEQVSPTFLTDDPDLAGFDRLLGELAQQAVVVPDSISVDERSGVVTGRLQLGDGLPEGEFEIDGDNYRVALTMGAKGAGGGAMVLRTVEVQFGADSAGIGSARSMIQFHPDTRRSSSEFLAQGEERYVGWAVRQTTEGDVTVKPIAMRAAADGAGWEIGNPNSLTPHPAPWAAGIGSAQSLYKKLHSVGK